MHKLVSSFALACLAITTVFAQGGASTAKPKPKSSASRTAKPAVRPAPSPEPNPIAVLHTTAGDISCELFKDKTPVTVNNFIGLATGTRDWTDPRDGRLKRNVPLYNGTIFHRVIPNFMIQGGDPAGTGMGGPGYEFQDEFRPDLQFDKAGVLAMANSGPNTNGSQFFITELPTPHLNNRHTIFGQCDDRAVEIVKAIARMPRDARDRPKDDVKIVTVDILGLKKAPAAKPSIHTAKPRPRPRPRPRTAPAK